MNDDARIERIKLKQDNRDIFGCDFCGKNKRVGHDCRPPKYGPLRARAPKSWKETRKTQYKIKKGS